MPSLKDYEQNFNTLLKAAQAGALALLDCADAKTGAQIATIVAVNRVDGEFEFVPLARMFEGNPYEALLPPNPSGEGYLYEPR